jgi:hypothetical protein
MDEDFFLGLLVLCAAALTVTLVLVWRTRAFLSRAARVPGRVTRITVETQEFPGYGADHPPETTFHYTPHVEFARADGTLVEFRSNVSHPGTPLHKEGDAVTVVYERGDPSTAQIAGPAVWRNAVFSGIATSALLLFTGFSKACA